MTTAYSVQKGEDKIMVTAAISRQARSRTHTRRIQVEKFPKSPLIVPDPNSSWMKVSVFNCGVIRNKDGLYTMLLRGSLRRDNQYSDIGLALSEDGENWFIHDEPVLRSGFNQHCVKGIEDPRIIEWIDGWCYIFASVYSYSSIYRVGIWRTRNFFDYEWRGILFDEREEFKNGEKNKNAVVFPELINNRVYLIHRWFPFPDMWLSMSHDGEISNNGWYGQQIVLRAEQLYSSPKTGVKPNSVAIAAPPIKTPKGWLVIVNVTHEENNPGRNYYGRTYSIGFVVLDLHDPRKINYIHPFPIVWPEEKYEITGGSTHVCYCCAAVDVGKAINVYWGAADTVIAAREIKKEDLRMCY